MALPTPTARPASDSGIRGTRLPGPPISRRTDNAAWAHPLGPRTPRPAPGVRNSRPRRCRSNAASIRNSREQAHSPAANSRARRPSPRGWRVRRAFFRYTRHSPTAGRWLSRQDRQRLWPSISHRSIAWQTLLCLRGGKRGQSPFVRSTLRAVPANGDCPLFPCLQFRVLGVFGLRDAAAA
jgi:hypothetical protein